MPDTVIELAHGGGGRLSRDLVRAEILPRFGDGPLQSLPDGATLPSPGEKLVFTTDSYVVQPIEFPGGNIGHLAVHGTVNDLAVCGAAPLWLSLGLILEEGLSFALLRRVLDAVRDAAAACGVCVVTGDTKVVGRGQCDGLFLNTSGIGRLLPGFDLSQAHVRPGDRVLVSGPVGDHGMAVMASRHGMDVSRGPVSDTAPVHRLVQSMLPYAASIRFMRDPTRGGLAAVLNEIVEDLPVEILVEEAAVPLSPGVRSLSELLGLDPFHVASEGRMLAICAPAAAPAVLEAWKTLPEGKDAAMIGSVKAVPSGRGAGRVVLHTVTGGSRLIDVPRGELLPRIC